MPDETLKDRLTAILSEHLNDRPGVVARLILEVVDVNPEWLTLILAKRLLKDYDPEWVIKKIMKEIQ